MNSFRTGYLISDISHLSRQIYAQRRADNMLTPTQAKALNLLAAHQGIHQVELAAYMDITPMSVMKIVDQLTGLDLIERKVDPDDRRAFRLYLRPRAKNYLSRIKSDAEKIWREALGDISAEQQDMLVRMLGHVSDNLSAIKQRQTQKKRAA